MKYYSTDRFQDFDFHDSEFSLISWDGDRLVVSAKCLNIHKDAAPNNAGADMEIETARITFGGFQIKEFEPWRIRKNAADGTSFTDEPRMIHRGEKAISAFRNELKNGFTVFGLYPDDGEYKLEAIGAESYFNARLFFSFFEVAWDDYKQKSWYELHRLYKKKVTLSTPCGDTEVEACIICNDEDVYFSDEAEKSPSVYVSITYGGNVFCGQGSDRLWVDAFADLQKKLPDDVRIKCCLTCRHGNMCPVGNSPDEIFCTQDVTITQISDLYFYTEDPAEREKRSREATGVCENYIEQSNSCFTYNDYLYYLK